jgi:hypothetical protein
MLEFIFVGTGRCGTSYVSRLLTAAGKSCGHEDVYTFNGYNAYAANNFQGDSSWLAVPYLNSLSEDVKIVHLVRDPIKVFRSWLFDQNSVLSLNPAEKPSVYSLYLLNHYPNVAKEKKTIDKAAMYYLECNRAILEYKDHANYFFHRVEAPPCELLTFLGCSPDTPYEYLTSTNTRNKKKIPEQEALNLIKDSKYYDELKELFFLFYPYLRHCYEF